MAPATASEPLPTVRVAVRAERTALPPSTRAAPEPPPPRA